ncbi:hypothetical protein ACIGXM_14265 [Kitasatospora sp. NPDC052896]|uniref:hypothetical protein n=1 Tax=Kitasatospora sp. NPDC052896 TaxID=3364061 RepID=UPI0037CA372A
MAWRSVYQPHAQVLLPTLESSAWVSELVLWQAEGAHQVMELTVRHVLPSGAGAQALRTPLGPVWAENSPVHVVWGWWADDNGDFYGYVASSRVLAEESDPSYNYAVVLPVVYTLVGASMPMQSRQNKLWSDVSPSWIARDIAQSYNMQAAVETSTVHYASRMQTASDWVFLTDLANQIGYRLFLNGTQLWFVSRPTVMPTADNSIPQFWSYKKPGLISSIRSFSAVTGDTDPAGGVRATYQTAASNDTSGVLAQAQFQVPRTDVRGASVQPLIRQQYDARPARSYTDAQTLLAGDTVYLWVECRAVLNGDPRLRPGTLVDLEGDGLGNQYTGLWMVRAATHRLTINHADPRRTDYTATVVVGRDDAQALTIPVQTTYGQTTPTVLVSDTWQAQSTVNS